MAATRLALEAAERQPPTSKLRQAALQCIAQAKGNRERASKLLWNRCRRNIKLLAELAGGMGFLQERAEELVGGLIEETRPKPKIHVVEHERTAPAPRSGVTLTVPRSAPAVTLATAAASARRSILDTEMVNGTRLRDCTIRDVSAYAKHLRARGRWLLALTENQPPDLTIGHVYAGRDGEVEALKARIEHEEN